MRFSRARPMSERSTVVSSPDPARIDLEIYSAELPLSSLAVGVDNIHHDVFLSPRCGQLARGYLLDLIRQTTKLAQFYGFEARPQKGLETGALKKSLTELLQSSLTRAK